MKTRHLSKIALLASLAIAAPAFAQKPGTDMPKAADTSKRSETGAAAAQNAPLTGVIASNASFSTLRKAIAQAGLEDTLSDKSNSYTIFAPTDEAFGKLPQGTLTKLMLPENKEKLRSLLLYHVVSGRITAAEAKSGEVKALNGESLRISATGDRVQVQDTSVTSPDMMAANGVIHSIGTVLIPKSLEGFTEKSD